MNKEFADLISLRTLKKLAKSLGVDYKGDATIIVKSILTTKKGLKLLKKKLSKRKQRIDAGFQADLLDILNELNINFVQKARFVKDKLTTVTVFAAKGAGGCIHARRLEKDYGLLPGVAIALKQRVHLKDTHTRGLEKLQAFT